MTSELSWPDRSWTLGANLRSAAQTRGDAPLISFGSDGPAYTVSEVDKLADCVGAGLLRLGLEHGDNLLLMLPNEPEMILSWFGAGRIGVVEAPVNTEYRGAFLEHLVNTSQGKVMVVRDHLVDRVVASAAKMPLLETLVVVGDPLSVAAPSLKVVPFDDLLADAPAFDPEIEPQDLSSINFTSGTTGPSKGAMMPHAYHHLMGHRCAELMDLGRGDVYLMPLPLYHIHAQAIMYACLVSGAAVHFEKKFSASDWISTIRRVGATHFTTLGVMLAFILKVPEQDGDAVNPMRRLWACPTPPALVAEFEERFDVPEIVTSYGNTEIGMISISDYDPERPEAVGMIADQFYDVEIVDDDGRPVPVGQAGEVRVRPKIPWILLQGYYGMPERMVEASRNLWFHTGDVMKVDERGYYYFLDRKDDRIRRRGENIASLDVEQVLHQHDRVADVAVVAVKSEIEGGEDELKASIVFTPGPEVDPEAFWAWSDEVLPAFSVPRYLEFLEQLPKTPTEKVQKFKLRKSGADAAVDRLAENVARVGR